MKGQQEETRLDREGTADTGAPTGQEEIALFEASEQEALRDRWSAIQTSFVDEPRRSVEEANDLVADLMNRLVSSFRDEQSRLEEQWSRGEEVTTQDLRMTLQRYRSFFGRVLKL
jgi:polyhydroxyalkanoate synthesis regulator phasin